MSLADTKRTYFTNGLLSAGVAVDPRWTNTDLEYQFYKTFSGVATGSVSDLRRAFLLKANKISSAPKSNEDLENDLFGVVPNAQFNSTVRVNLVKNPACEILASFQSMGSSGPTVSLDNTTFVSGANSLKATHVATTGGGPAIKMNEGIQLNTTYSVGIWVLVSATQNIQIYGELQNAAAGYRAISNPPGGQSITLGTWTRLTYTFTTDNNFNTAYIGHFGALAVAPAIGDTLSIDEVLLEVAPTVGTYFDGNSAGCYWEGTAHASRSIKIV